jgi:hypothetical protein
MRQSLRSVSTLIRRQHALAFARKSGSVTTRYRRNADVATQLRERSGYPCDDDAARRMSAREHDVGCFIVSAVRARRVLKDFFGYFHSGKLGLVFDLVGVERFRQIAWVAQKKNILEEHSPGSIA